MSRAYLILPTATLLEYLTAGKLIGCCYLVAPNTSICVASWTDQTSPAVVAEMMAEPSAVQFPSIDSPIGASIASMLQTLPVGIVATDTVSAAIKKLATLMPQFSPDDNYTGGDTGDSTGSMDYATIVAILAAPRLAAGLTDAQRDIVLTASVADAQAIFAKTAGMS